MVVPVHILPDGRQFIAAKDCADHPGIAAFVAAHPNYWTPAHLTLDGYIGPKREEEMNDGGH